MNDSISKFFSSFRKPFRYTFKNISLLIIALNFIIFVSFKYLSLPFDENIFSLSYVGIAQKEFWQPLTYMFMHGSWSHLIFNMLALFFFGIPVEKAIGSKEFSILYLSVGIFCGLFSLTLYYFLGRYQISCGTLPVAWIYQLVGASGAIYGILLSYAVIFPHSKIFVYGLIPVPAPILVLIYAIIEFFSQFFASSNVAHYAHLAGFIFAFVYFILRMGVNPIRVWKNAYK